MLKGFKKFLMRGNIIELATAVVMGTAFTAIVTSVTKGIVEPLLAMVGTNGKLGLGVQLMGSKPATFVAIGPIISAAINFLMVAAILYFVLIAPMNSIQKRMNRNKKSEPTQTELLKEIRDLLVAQNKATGIVEDETSETEGPVPDPATPKYSHVHTARRRVTEMVRNR
ncbi:MAG: large conductance mechanosensitive channel protein MscL [Nocardia sp.]|nr:large conductance mechanosensitive channel protein MscL [Nocardia sp.]